MCKNIQKFCQNQKLLLEPENIPGMAGISCAVTCRNQAINVYDCVRQHSIDLSHRLMYDDDIDTPS